MNELLGSGVSALVSDQCSLRLFQLLLCTYTLTPLLLKYTPYFWHKVIFPPGHCLYLSHNLHLPNKVNFPPGSLLTPSHNPDYLLCLSTFPWFLLHGYPFLSPPSLCFPRISFQGFPKLFICHPLAPPYLSPATSPLLARLACTYFRYWSQRYPLYHSCLLSLYVGHHWLCYLHFLHYFRPRHLPYPAS